MNADPRCPRCEGRGYVIHQNADGYAKAETCGCGEACSECGGRGVIEVFSQGYPAVQLCRCRTATLRVKLFNAAGIPGRCLHSGFQRPPHELLEADPLIQTAWTRAYRFATMFDEGQSGFLLYGGPGTLKTSILCATLAYLTLDRGIECRYIEFSLLLARIRETMRDSGNNTPLQPLRLATVLTIDELGKMRGTDWERAMLDDLISSRYQAGRTTLFATNYPVKPSRDRDMTLEQAVESRIFSRVFEMCEFVPTGNRDARRVRS